MSLPNEEVLGLLRSEFVVGHTNIERELHVGMSHGYRCTQTAVGTTNGAGGRNLQLIVMSPDETVLHVIPGFWHPADLARELRFALCVHRLWHDDGKDGDDKLRLYAAMHRVHVRGFDADTIARSDWQSFDRRFELNRYEREPRDSVTLDGDGIPQLKPVCVLVHQRMASRPFVSLGDFDMESFVDYGRPYYDNNAWIDQGTDFRSAERANRKRAKLEAKAKKALEKGA